MNWPQGENRCESWGATVGPQDPHLFSPWGQFTVFAVYTAILLVVGGILFRKRDA